MHNPPNIFVVISLYFFPILGLTLFAHNLSSSKDSWSIFSLGMAIALSGSISLFFLFLKHFPSNKQKDDQILPKENNSGELEFLQKECVEWQNKCSNIAAELESEKKQAENIAEQCRQYSQQLSQTLEEYQTYKNNFEEQFQKNNLIIQESHKTIMEQRTLISKQQHHISILENKERDLHFEIKSLLHLASPTSLNDPVDQVADASTNLFSIEEEQDIKAPVDFSVSTPDAAETLLKRCLDIATKMTGAHYFGSPGKFRDLPTDSYALDVRRLFDSLKSETASIILVYSQKENKLLFANSRVRDVLGWSPEKFVLSFPEIISENMQDWKKAMNALVYTPETKVSLSLKKREGDPTKLSCHLGSIHVGLFRQHVIGVLYESGN